MMSSTTRQGSLKLVDSAKVAARGALFVTEARLRAMMKWVWLIISLAIANPVLYLVSIGLGVGSYIDKNTGGMGVDGVSYITFLAPALLATAAIQGAIDESVFPTLEGFKWNKIFFSMNSTPLSGNHIAMGVFFNSLIRVVFTAIIYWFVMLAFGVLESPRAWLAIFTAIMAGAAFGAMMQALAGMLENENIFFTVLNRFVIMPLFLFSGTFYPLTNMPIYLQWIGWISPLWHATELGRWLTYGHEISSLMLYIHFIFLNSLLLVGIIASRRIFTRRLGK
jgi:lipooligosaccharide transport system permease protein